MAHEFADLIAAVQGCRRCASMEGRRRVLSEGNGRPGARVMFVAEAPGRRGGEVTGVPLSRDASGQRFSRLLAMAGLRREEVFITNAVLCNPRTAEGTNRTPSRTELANCAGWLEAQLLIVDPPVVVTLGAVALAAMGRIEAHGLTLRADVGRAVGWRERVLVPLYHPSPRAGLWRRYEEQDEDFRRLGEMARVVTTTEAPSPGPSPTA
ncbi:MAG: uracil-DNA glycosylase, partial [Dehalococcoidia bacterium]